MKHFAIIPARKNSLGFKNKNRILFRYTVDFLKKLKWFEKIILSTDDKFLIKKAKKQNYILHKRSKKNSSASASIKSVMMEVKKNYKFNSNDIIWLFYLTIPHRNKKDFLFAKKKFLLKNIKSIISFRSSLTHPDDSWKITKNKIMKFTKNNVYRRQDKIKLFEHYHYISAFKVSEIQNLNDELINKNTYPIYVKEKKKNSLVEIDNKADYQRFLKIKKNEKFTNYIEQKQ